MEKLTTANQKEATPKQLEIKVRTNIICSALQLFCHKNMIE
jgi:hypothetical protein